MQKRFWLKLSMILWVGIFLLSLSLSWFFSVFQSRQLNHQRQQYLSENFFLLHNHLNRYLKKNSDFSFFRLQNIISLYSAKASFKIFSSTEEKKSIFLINEEGLILVHSEQHYRGEKTAEYIPCSLSHPAISKGLGSDNPPGPLSFCYNNGPARFYFLQEIFFACQLSRSRTRSFVFILF